MRTRARPDPDGGCFRNSLNPPRGYHGGWAGFIPYPDKLPQLDGQRLLKVDTDCEGCVPWAISLAVAKPAGAFLTADSGHGYVQPQSSGPPGADCSALTPRDRALRRAFALTSATRSLSHEVFLHSYPWLQVHCERRSSAAPRQFSSNRFVRIVGIGPVSRTSKRCTAARFGARTGRELRQVTNL
jgi:hypothetical protein